MAFIDGPDNYKQKLLMVTTHEVQVSSRQKIYCLPFYTTNSEEIKLKYSSLMHSTLLKGNEPHQCYMFYALAHLLEWNLLNKRV